MEAIRLVHGGYYNSPLPKVRGRKNVPLGGGVYILYEGDKIAYIGQAASIRVRLAPGHHVYKPGMEVSWIYASNDKLRYSIEQALIYTFHPIYNRQRVADFYGGGRIDRLIIRCQKRPGVQLPLIG